MTLVERDPATREEHTVMRTRWVTATTDFQLAGLTDKVKREWVPDGKWVRALKFPSGELPGAPGAIVQVGISAVQGAPPGLSGWVDEIRLASARKTTTVLSGAIDATTTTVPPFSGAALSITGGAVLVGNEVIGYAGIDTATGGPTGCVRGYLGTTREAHDAGDRVFSLTFLGVAALAVPATPTDKSLSCATSGFSRRGYALVGSEIVGATRRTATRLSMPSGADFRGAFGTVPAAHATGDLVYAFPGGSLGDVVADELEARVYFVFRDGAYAQGEWKETPELHGLTVEYEQPTVVHEHEEK